MLLAVDPFTGFTGLLQILLIIVAMFLITAFVITMVMHYRRKKKELEPGEVQQIIAASPETSGFKLEDEYVLFDHSGLLREYKTKLINNHARYTALKQDFDKLENKYNSLLLGNPSASHHIKTGNMEQPIAAPQELDELREKLEKLNQSCQHLEKEKMELSEKITILSAGEEKKLEILDRLKDENLKLKNKLADQEYIKDVLEEKKTQIDFLQQQLEHRIKNYHQAEQQLGEMKEQLMSSRLELDESRSFVQSAKAELQEKHGETSRLQSLVNEKEQDLRSRLDHITYLENTLQEIKEQNELLNATVADIREKTSNLEQLLEDEQFKANIAEQKLLSNKQLVHRLYKEFSACIDEETGESPIVALRPAYISKSTEEEWNETAVQ